MIIESTGGDNSELEERLRVRESRLKLTWSASAGASKLISSPPLLVIDGKILTSGLQALY